MIQGLTNCKNITKFKYVSCSISTLGLRVLKGEQSMNKSVRNHVKQWSFLGLIKMWELKLLPVPSGPALRWLRVQSRISGVWNWSVGPADMTLYKKDVFQCDIILYLAGKLRNGYVYIMKWVKQILNG